MSATIRHFAINADDVERAKAFYEQVFGWTYRPWGPPGFYQADAGQGVMTALQGRREIKPGAQMLGVEATMGVDDISAATQAIEAAGGKIVGGPFQIPTVGTLIWFEDTEGNILGAMRYEQSA